MQRKNLHKGLLIANAVMFVLLVGAGIGFFFGLRHAASPATVVRAAAPEGDLESLQLSYRNVSNAVLPSVVQIETVSIEERQVMRFIDPFEEFFRNRFGGQSSEEKKPEEKQEFRSRGLGSGVIIRQQNGKYYILTNYHVVKGADEVSVRLYNDKTYNVKQVGGDERSDVAVLELETKDTLTVIQIGDSDAVEVGDIVLAIGSPYGFTASVTQGIISAKGRKGPAGNVSEFLQTDAAINRGNSGGALVDLYGRLIGINTWIATQTGENAGLAFAIPVNSVIRKADSLINNGSISYGWLGISITDLQEDLMKEMGLTGKQGAFVANVFIGSPADKGGIRPGDYIVSVDGENIKDSDMLVRLISDFRAGDRPEFSLIRNGRTETMKVEIAKRESEDSINAKNNLLWPGIIVAPVDDSVRSYFRLDKDETGIAVIQMEKDSKLAVGGLRPGDIIVSVNDKAVKSVTDFYNAVGQDTGKISVEYKRQGSTFFIGVKK
ncbi:MAG: Do family serine endopeptidase [Spirochaetia bacterium]|nr:Do family serine endopeptidase [Spirochaetia bacterium]